MKKLLLGILFPITAFSQWTNNSKINTPVCAAADNQYDERIISDGMGGAITIWTDDRTGAPDIYVQRLDSAGNAKWTADGIAICADANDQFAPVLVEDGSGGAIIVWKDLRNGNSDIYAQHVNSAGAVQWTINGIAVDTKSGEQIDPKIISDGANGAIIVWQDSLSGSWDIYAQRISGSGVNMWSAGGMAVCTTADDQKNPRIEIDGSGGAIIVWQDKRNTNDYDIYAQRLNSSGVPQWAANGEAVCSFTETQNNPKLKSDGAGGAIIAWTDKRNISDYDVYAQRLNSSGVSQWTANGKVISTEVNNQSAIDISTENISGAIITWKDYRTNIYADVYAQYINLAGAVQWTVNGIAVSTKPFDQINPNIVTDSAGAIIVWQDSSSGQWDVYGQKILLNGTSQWGTNGKIICNADSSQISPKHISDGKGGAIVCWQDKRSGQFDIYTQNINSDGSLGTIVGMDEKMAVGNGSWQIYPNPNDGKFNLIISQFDNLKMGKLKIYNILGEIVYSEKLSTINYQLSTNLPIGIYFYKISFENNFIQTGKMVVR